MRKSKIFLLPFFITHFSSAQTFSDSFFHPDSLRRIVEILASDSMQGRLSGRPGNVYSAIFIANEFKKAGLKPVAGDSGYFQPIPPYGFNVIGALPGKTKTDEIIIFCAHYDHIGTISTNPFPFVKEKVFPRKKDSIYNGANDNASGVSAVIALGKYFAALNNQERTILFIAFSGEENGLLGSRAFASQLNADLIKAVINIEMIGRKSSGHYNPFMTGSEKSNLYEIMNYELYKSDPKFYKKFFIRHDSYPSQFLFERSDNYPFAELGIPAHTIMASGESDQYYHSLSDEPSTLDYEVMSKIVNAIALATHGLITGKVTPSRLH